MCRDSTSDRILATAGPIFAVKGYQAATIREICKSAGVNVAAVNYYFGDKQHLYLETVKLARRTRAEQVPMPDWSAGTPPQVKLRDYIHTLAHRMLGMQQAPWQVRLMMREIQQPTAACRELVHDYFRPLFNTLLAIVGEVLPPDTPIHVLQQIGFSIIGQCVHYRFAGQVVAFMVGEEQLTSHFRVEQLADHVTRFSLAALGLAPAMGAANETPETISRFTE